MPQVKRIIDTHPQKKEILEAIATGKTYRYIAEQYGISPSSINRLVRSELGKRIAEARKSRDILDATFVLEVAGKASHSLDKMLDACNRYLEDPDDPEAFNVGPRASDVEIVREISDDDGRVIRTERGSLQWYLDQIDGNRAGETVEVKTKHDDPRGLIVRTADAVNRQLAVVAKIRAEAMRVSEGAEERRRVVESEMWQRMSQVITEAARRCPQVEAYVKRELDRIRDTAPGG